MKEKGLSDKDFSEYYSGNMSDKKTHEFESMATDDDFIGDATDGFMDNPDAAQNLGAMKEKFYQQNQISGKFSGASKIIIGLAGVLILVFAGIMFLKEEPKSTVAKNENPPAKPNEDQPKENIAPVDTTSQENIEITEEIKKAEPVSPKVVQVDQKEIQVYEEELSLEKLEMKEVLSVDLKNKKREIRKKKVAFTYMADFKVVDYSEIYTHQAKKNKRLTGLRAEYENTVDQLNDDGTVTVSYEQFLENAMYKLKAEKFDQCVEALNMIKETYPEDLNADFYLGICYFNQEKYKLAKINFENALFAPYYIFDEETEWYLYLSYKALDKKKEASKLLTKIKERKGFYYQRALKE